MTPLQKKICRILLTICEKHGWGSFPLPFIMSRYFTSDELKSYGVSHQKDLYDNETNTGLLWDIGPHGKGYIIYSGEFDSGTSIGVNYDMRKMLELWTDFETINEEEIRYGV